MNDTTNADTLAATHNQATNTQKKPRKTKTPEQKIAELEIKQAQLAERVKAEKAKIQGQARKQDTRRKIVAGAIALEHMEHDENFKGVMRDLLQKHVKDKDLQLFDL